MPDSLCPVCGQTGGFHNRDKHDEHEVPRELLLESGWHKKKDESSSLVGSLKSEIKEANAWGWWVETTSPNKEGT